MSEARLNVVKQERSKILEELNQVRAQITAFEAHLKPAVPKPPVIIKQSEADDQLNEYPVEGESDSDSLNF